MAHDFARRLRATPGRRTRLTDRHADDTPGIDHRRRGEKMLEANAERLFDLQYLLYAENRRSLLIVLQGMDSSGKDGTIRHVMRGLNPQGCTVTSFKQPSAEELDHDFLWRIHKALPARGDFGIFNRSHYEDVLVVRVQNLVPKSVWSARYAQINAFEKHATENGVVILKFCLHVSKDEQRRRLQDRLKDPTKNWKFAPGDLETRKHWDEYVRAYEDAIAKCNTPWAPWYVIPSDHKWYRNLAVSSIIVETLERLDLRLPKPAFDLSNIRIP